MHIRTCFSDDNRYEHGVTRSDTKMRIPVSGTKAAQQRSDAWTYTVCNIQSQSRDGCMLACISGHALATTTGIKSIPFSYAESKMPLPIRGFKVSTGNMSESRKKAAFFNGVRDGIPIALGYLAVSFSLGIAAKKAGLNAFQGFLASILNVASAGEYAGFTMIASDASYLSIALITLITNARYLLMSTVLSQRTAPEMKPVHRLFVSYGITDEIFAISVARPGYLNPWYHYGAIAISVPLWSIGTSLGIIAGNMLSVRLVSAFSVALYGMFLAIFISPMKKDRTVRVLIPVCFAASYLCSVLPGIRTVSSGTRIIILTLAIAGSAAAIRPIPEEKDSGQKSAEKTDVPEEK